MASRILYYIVIYPLSLLPLWVLYRFSDLFFLMLITIFPYRKKIIQQNIQNSFPHLTEKERNRLIKKFYRHFADILLEGVKNISISERELSKRFKVVNPEIMEDLYKNQKSVILVSGHYNNWEWLISFQNNLFSHQAMGIGMPLSNPFWNQKINERRQRFGMIVVHSKNYKSQIKALNPTPIAILTLADQSPGDSRKSYWTNFLNQKTAVLFGAELMAHELDFAVVYFHVVKLKRGYYEMKLELITDQPKALNWGEITEKHTSLLEKDILKNPQFWMWSHKRWKRSVPHDLPTLKKEQHEAFNRKFKNY